MDIKIPKNGVFEIPIKKNWNSIIYAYEGEVEYSCANKNHQFKALECCVLEKSKDNDLVHTVKSKNGASFMLVGGEPIN